MQNQTRQIDTWYSLLVCISMAYDEWFYHNFVMFRSQNLHHKNTHQPNANSENSISYENFVFAYFYVLLHFLFVAQMNFFFHFSFASKRYVVMVRGYCTSHSTRTFEFFCMCWNFYNFPLGPRSFFFLRLRWRFVETYFSCSPVTRRCHHLNLCRYI